MNWKESLTKGYKHMTIPRKTVLIFAAVLVLPLLVVTVIWLSLIHISEPTRH